MSHDHDTPYLARVAALPVLLLTGLLGIVILALVNAPTARAVSPHASTYSAQPVRGRHIYDCANILTADEIATLETQAAAVEQAGAPVVVSLQLKDATFDQTAPDAANLMQRWNLESRPGARDGFLTLRTGSSPTGAQAHRRTG